MVKSMTTVSFAISSIPKRLLETNVEPWTLNSKILSFQDLSAKSNVEINVIIVNESNNFFMLVTSKL